MLDIYKNKKPEDKVILDNAHAHLAHLVVKEAFGELPVDLGTGSEIDLLLARYGIHCDRKAGCDASGGSLGHALGIAIGMAFADHSRAVHVVVSDGSMMEGSCWEALRIIADNKLDQIHIYCNFNGYTAVSEYNTLSLEKRMKAFTNQIKIYHTDNGEGFEGIQGHYRVLLKD